MSLLIRELAFSIVQTATSSEVNPPTAEVLPIYPSTRTPASSNTLYIVLNDRKCRLINDNQLDVNDIMPV